MITRTVHQPWLKGKYAQSERLPSLPLPDDLEELDMREIGHISRAIQTLHVHYAPLGNVLVGGMGYLCWNTRTSSSTWLIPDLLVAFGIDLESAIRWNGYVIDEVGKPPEFILEVASEHTGTRDYTVKREGYARYGVPEYWRFDHTGGDFHDQALAGDRLVNGEYDPISLTTEPDGMIWGRSKVLGLDLCWDDGNLRFYDPAAGRYLPDIQDALEERDAERVARQNAEASVEVERAVRQDAETRAEAAEAELRRLREQLRQGQSE